jgi:hypothetical protein
LLSRFGQQCCSGLAHIGTGHRIGTHHDCVPIDVPLHPDREHCILAPTMDAPAAGIPLVVLCPGPPGRLSALSVSLCKSVLCWAFVWACRALKHQKRWLPARAVHGYSNNQYVDPWLRFSALAEARAGLGRIFLLCTTAHPLPTRFANRFGASISEATKRPDPRPAASCSSCRTARTPGPTK